jgi:LAS superfamily LD-carboxypeptidase LdcB
LSLLVIIPLLAVGLYGVYSFINSKQFKTIQTAKAPVRFTEPAKKGVLKNFTGPEFRDLYNSFAYPNTKRIAEDTPITSNPDADARIRKIAEDRGYHIRSAPVTDAFREVAPGMKLQERAADPWLQMVEAAKKDKETLILTAAYRSADEQKKILLDRLGSDGINIALIGRGIYDQRINEVLRTTAVPGYSRHHTGYTIDIGCQNDPSVIFDESSCFKWLSADNYKNAKTFGWIPSYPPGAGNQGPEPESWEYVWVGVDTLTE